MTYTKGMKRTAARMTDRGFLIISLSVKARRLIETAAALGHGVNSMDTLLAELCDQHDDLGRIAVKLNWDRIVRDVRKDMKMVGVKNV